MYTNRLARRIAGNEYKIRDYKKFWVWIDEQAQTFPDLIRVPFEGIILKDIPKEDMCRETRLAWATLRGRLYTAYDILRSVVKTMPRRRFDAIFVSVYEYQFSKVVSNRELTECLFGHYDRRSTQVITVKWIPKTQSGVFTLPMPAKKGNHWEWTRSQAMAWRMWFVEEYGERNDD